MSRVFGRSVRQAAGLQCGRLPLGNGCWRMQSRGAVGVSINKLLTLDPLVPRLAPDRKTKIVCTVGPASWDENGVRKLLAAGMNVMRLNCSHGDHSLYEKTINTLRKCVAEVEDADSLVVVQNVSCAVAIDTKGPEIRLGDFAKGGEPISVPVGKTLRLHVNPDMRACQDADNLFVDYPSLRKAVFPGAKIFVDDGLLSLEVGSFEKDGAGHDVVICTAENEAKISSRKGVNIPGADLDLPAVSEKDREDLKFAREQHVDYIFASFIRKPSHVREIREIVGPEIKIIAKIENQEGIKNINGIITEADGVMVARGDLGIEIPQENVFLAQKLIVSKANLVGKPVICATQMLDSMTRSPRPTRAECADVANAVLDGCDAVMLSGETANGLYPFHTVDTMSKICRTAEYSQDSRVVMENIRNANLDSIKPECEALVVSAVVATFEEDAKLLIVLSDSGESARIAAKYRPAACILCLTSNEKAARRLQLTHGIKVIAIPKEMSPQEQISVGVKKAFHLGIVGEGNRVVAIHSRQSFMKLLDVPKWIGKM
uniref:Pyruvate kinase n=1 Tax=Mucochytrium quahogii TaxID=96639 RepID=A0A7S2S1R5_9STRA